MYAHVLTNLSKCGILKVIFQKKGFIIMIKMLQNLHTHVKYCDGKDTPREMVERALALGFTALGFSSHANTCFDDTCELRGNVTAYRTEIQELKKEYEGRIKIYLGTELDYYTPGYMDLDGYDYKIASVHYGVKDGAKICYDFSVERSQRDINEYFGGDIMAYAGLYYETMADMPNVLSGDFVGHFDIVTKFEEKAPHLFNTGAPEYRKMALEALHAVREKYELFEVNTGAIGRGHKNVPYPAPFILDEMRAVGAKLLISTDCHNKNYLDCGFAEAVELIRAHGFKVIYELTDGGFKGRKI